MPTYRPIHTESDLPPIGTSRETLALDFKQKPASKAFERAKDIAAFANSTGGVILIGASDKNEALAGWVPMTEQDAAQAARDYDKAAHDWCSPSPLVDPTPLRRDESNWVVAVNVEPFPGQAVGVRTRSDKRKTDYGGDAYVFPWRSGTNTIFLKPEQLVMWMVPSIRYVVVLLSKIGDGDAIRVKTRGGGMWVVLKFSNVAPLENTVTLTKQDSSTVVVPLDRVISVWHDQSWRMTIDGYLRNGVFIHDKG